MQATYMPVKSSSMNIIYVRQRNKIEQISVSCMFLFYANKVMMMMMMMIMTTIKKVAHTRLPSVGFRS